jgi:hypothetical protein
MMAKVTLGEAFGKELNDAKRRAQLNRKRNNFDFIQGYVNYTRNQEATEKIHTWVALSVIAGALERKVWISMGHFVVYPNLYTLIVGESGVVRKSTSTGIGINLLRELDDFKFMSERVTDRSLIDQMRSAKVTFQHEGTDTVQSAVFCYASELIVFMREISGSISELLTTFWDCNKVFSYQTKADGEIIIPSPCLNMLGASTPTWLRRAIPGDEMEGGLASRILFVHEENHSQKFIAWPKKENNEASEMRRKLIDDLKQIHSLVGEFAFTRAAHDFYEDWYKDYMTSPPRFTDPRFKGYHGRKSIYVLKIAMLLSISESNSLVGEIDHISRAIELLEDLEEPMLRAFGSVGENRLASGMERVIAKLKEGPMHQSQVIQFLYNDFTGMEIKALLTDMQSMKEIALDYSNYNDPICMLSELSIDPNEDVPYF